MFIINHLALFWRAYALNSLLILLVLSGHTLAYGATDEITSGSFQLSPVASEEEENGQGSASTPQFALLKNTDVNIEVNGMIARVIVRQTFENTSESWMEGEYLFPLPENSAVDYMAMQIGERKIVGKIQEKQQAKKIYEEAKQAGKKASLVEQQRPNLFTNHVANIAPGETIVTEIQYVETLRYDMGKFSLRVPTTITPRYIPGIPLHSGTSRATHHDSEDDTAEFANANSSPIISEPIKIESSGWALATDQVPDANLITPPMKPSHLAAQLSLTANINAGIALDEIKSVYHPAQTSSLDNNYHVTLDNSAKLNRDVVLQWTPATGSAPVAAVFQENIDDEYYLLLMMLPPQQLTTTNSLPKETIFIIDTSGSMAGVSIEQAKQALLNGVQQLNPGDRFNVIEFNSRYRPLWPQAVPVTQSNAQQAIQFLSSLTADGGTEMFQPLQFALNGQAPDGYVRQIIFMTDGSVGNEDALINLIEQYRGNSRVFTVGIGSAPNSFFMSEAARAGQGSFTYIGAQAEVSSKMSELFHKLQNPVMTNISLDFGDGKGNVQIESLPARIPDLYAGEPVVVAVKSQYASPDYVLINGELAGKPFQQQLTLTNRKNADSVSKLWARRKLQELYNTERTLSYKGNRQASGDEKISTPEQIKTDITQLALQHQLMSKYTSFVAVEEKVSRPLDKMLQKHLEANAMPNGNTMAIPVPAGALGLAGLWQLGLLSLLGLVLINWRNLSLRQWIKS